MIGRKIRKFPTKPFSLDCPRCENGRLKLDENAFDETCQGKDVFLFVCLSCGGLSATSMHNISINEWYKFVPDNRLANLVEIYEKRRSSFGW